MALNSAITRVTGARDTDARLARERRLPRRGVLRAPKYDAPTGGDDGSAYARVARRYAPPVTRGDARARDMSARMMRSEDGDRRPRCYVMRWRAIITGGASA